MASKLHYRVWDESSNLIYSGEDGMDNGTRDGADAAMGEAITEHILSVECNGCGVLTPPEHHGYHVQILRGGWDVTADPTVA